MRRRYATALRKLVRLSPREWRNLLRAQWELLRVRRLVRTLPTGTLTAGAGDGAASATGDPDRLPDARALAVAVNRAAYFGLGPSQCLVRAMALSRLMERDGMPGGVVRVGVRRREGRMEAHAWVDFAGEILGDHEENVGTFAELSDLQIVRRP